MYYELIWKVMNSLSNNYECYDKFLVEEDKLCQYLLNQEDNLTYSEG